MSLSRVLIIGKTGQVASALREVLPSAEIEATAIGRPDLDLMVPGAAADAIHAAKPTLVVLAAAYTAVDRAEDEPEAARRLNALAPGEVAAAAADCGAAIIHLSTDYVFDGAKSFPYSECDAPAPLGVYGATKLAGEMAVAAANPRHVILRTAWVCSPTGSNFVKTMLRLAAERPCLRVVADQFGAPTFAVDIARGIRDVALRLESGGDLTPEHFGVFNLAGEGLTSWHGFAQAIMRGAAARGRETVPVEAITTAEYPTRAKRPAYSKLSNEKIAGVYGVHMPAWETALETCLDTLIAPPAAASRGDEL
jgi:dTDP-4-dehydrorhamnose reductase